MARLSWAALLAAVVASPAATLQTQRADPDQESRQLTADATEQPEFCKETKVWWLHTPKCGTSFANTVHYCDQENFGGQRHEPLPLGMNENHVVAIFRMPAQRLASAFTFAKEARNCMGGWGANATTSAEVLKQLDAGRTAATDSFLGQAFLGCQTNMVLGRTCMAGTPTDVDADAKEAIKRVDNFRFTGLLEEWGLSMCLFNYEVTGKRFVTSRQLVDTRPTTSKRKSAMYDTANYPRDDADEQLYAHVVAKFTEKVKKYGITKEACSFDEKGKALDFMVASVMFGDHLFIEE